MIPGMSGGAWIAAGLALLAGTALAGTPGADAGLPVPVAGVDLARYAGLWYEVARIPNRFQSDCASNVTALYEIRDDGRIRVVNRCESSDGRVRSAEGVAKVADPQTNARLKVSFVSFLGIRPFWGDYWILGLGEEYEYAVVGSPDRKYGWILARSPRPDGHTMDAVWRILREQGYDPARFRLSTPDSGAGTPSAD